MPQLPTPDVAERTTLAGERTLLAWWRTGLAALAVGFGVGRLGPELRSSGEEWPYVVLGFGFAIYGICLIVYGQRRGNEVTTAARHGELSDPGQLPLRVLTATGVLLGAGTALLILLG